MQPSKAVSKLVKVSGPLRMQQIEEGKAEVLCLVPKTVDFPEFQFHGSTKDILNRREYFNEREIPFHEFCIVRKEEAAIDLLDLLQQVRPLAEYRFIFLDLPGTFPKLTRYLRDQAPKSSILFRSHNAEYLHRLDWMAAEKHWGKKAKYGWEAIRGRHGDKRLLSVCDHVLSIADWDTHHYWRALDRKQNPTRVLALPYFLPTSLLPASERFAQKEDRCVCVGAITKSEKNAKGGKAAPLTPLASNMYERFSRLVDGLNPETSSRWKFALTGSVPANQQLSTRIQVTGLLESPFDALYSARAVCQLSELGRGFKTKILDAIAAKAYVLMPDSLYERLPLEILPFCIPMADESVGAFEKALEASRAPWPALDPNAALRARAFQVMDWVFKVKPDPQIGHA